MYEIGDGCECGSDGAAGYRVSWADALEEQFGSVPWWVVSAGVHVIVLLVLTLVTVSTPPVQVSETIIPLDVVQTPPPEQPPVRTPTPIDFPASPFTLDEQPHQPVFTTEQPDFDDHMETENNRDDDTRRGQEDAFADIPLAKSGLVGVIGAGGGGGGCFGIRNGGGKRRAILRGGGNSESESKVKKALLWLVNNQEPDGHWAVQKWEGRRDEDANVGVTGLGLLALLGAGHTEKLGDHKAAVRRAVLYLVSRQDARGMIGTNTGHEHGGGYNHAIAGLALAEAFGMARVGATGIAAQKAVDFSVQQFQTEYSGWRYRPGSSDADTSVTGWFIMQLKSASIAGLKVDARGYQGAIAWLDKVTELPGPTTAYGGRASYQPGREPSSTMTAVALLGRQFMGFSRTEPVMVGAANHLMDELPKWNGGPAYMFYYWYYGTLCMFQMGGDWWKAWNVAMRDMLVHHQIDAPNDRRLDGSWDPIQDGEQGGRAYSTAICCLCLEVYYRYLPTMQ
jgi:hypothetical protein